MRCWLWSRWPSAVPKPNRRPLNKLLLRNPRRSNQIPFPHNLLPRSPSPDAQSSPAPAEQDAAAAPAQPAAQPATATAPTELRVPNPDLTPEEVRKQQVAEQCADLLKLATDLKAQVDKARKDELSVSVVRKATEIEQMAHKVRNGTTLESSTK